MNASALPQALRMNALASCVTGLACLSLAAPLEEALGIARPRLMHLAGALLLLHCVLLLWATGRARIADWTRRNLRLIVPYSILLLAVVVLGFVPTATGRAILLADAALVAALAAWQWRALSAAPQPAR